MQGLNLHVKVNPNKQKTFTNRDKGKRYVVANSHISHESGNDRL